MKNRVYIITEKTGDKNWPEIGKLWPSGDSQNLSGYIHCPLNGKIQVSVFRYREYNEEKGNPFRFVVSKVFRVEDSNKYVPLGNVYPGKKVEGSFNGSIQLKSVFEDPTNIYIKPVSRNPVQSVDGDMPF